MGTETMESVQELSPDSAHPGYVVEVVTYEPVQPAAEALAPVQNEMNLPASSEPVPSTIVAHLETAAPDLFTATDLDLTGVIGNPVLLDSVRSDKDNWRLAS